MKLSNLGIVCMLSIVGVVGVAIFLRLPFKPLFAIVLISACIIVLLFFVFAAYRIDRGFDQTPIPNETPDLSTLINKISISKFSDPPPGCVEYLLARTDSVTDVVYSIKLLVEAAYISPVRATREQPGEEGGLFFEKAHVKDMFGSYHELELTEKEIVKVNESLNWEG